MIVLVHNSSKFYSRSLTLIVHILDMVGEHYTHAQIAKILDITKSHVTYYVKKAIHLFVFLDVLSYMS
jgi:hypothetical protein